MAIETYYCCPGSLGLKTLPAGYLTLPRAELLIAQDIVNIDWPEKTQ